MKCSIGVFTVVQYDAEADYLVMVHPQRRLCDLTIRDDTIEVIITLQRELLKKNQAGVSPERTIWTDLAFSPSMYS